MISRTFRPFGTPGFLRWCCQVLKAGLAGIYPGSVPGAADSQYRRPHPVFNHPSQPPLIGRSVFFTLSVDGDLLPLLITKLPVGRKGGTQSPFSIQHHFYPLVTFQNDIPKVVLRILNITGFSNEEIILLIGKELRDTAFPKGMDPLLTAKLAVVVFGGMQRNMGIAQVMSQFSRQAKDSRAVLSSKSFGKPLLHPQ